MGDWPARVKIVEVGPRDGLQNEAGFVPTDLKLAFIRALAGAGLKHIEATSFVHPKAIPQTADAIEVASALPRGDGVEYSALVPNVKGLERAIQTDIRRIAVFTAASETFVKKNINMSIDESIAAFEPVVRLAAEKGISVRGYVSTAFVCPYEGEIAKERVLDVTQKLLALGCDEIAISDTIGAAAPTDVEGTVGFLLQTVPEARLALHFHDTYGTALANVCAGMRLGITTFDSSAGGLGGCPYAKGASGNLATEDLVYLLDRMGVETGVDLTSLAGASEIISRHFARELPSRQLKRILAVRQLKSND